MRKRLILLLILLVLLGAGGGLYYAARFLPGFVHEKLVKGLTEATGRRVTLDTVKLELGRGFVIHNLRIYGEAETDKTLLSVDEAAATVILLPWDKKHKLLIPSLRIYGARLDLVRGQDGNLDIRDILDRRKSSSSAGAGPLVKYLHVTDSEVALVDEMRATPSTTMVRFSEAKAKTSWNKIFLDADIEVVFNDIQVPATLQGNYTYKEKRWDLRLDAQNIDPGPFLPYLPALPFVWKEGCVRQLRVDAAVMEGTLQLKPRVSLAGVAGAKEMIAWDDAALTCEAAFKAPLTDWAGGRLDGRLTVATAAFRVDGPGVKTEGRMADMTGPFTWHDNGFEMMLTGTAQAPRVILGDVIVNDAAADITARLTRTASADGSPCPAVFTAKAALSAAKAEGLPRIGSVKDIGVDAAYAEGAVTFSEGRARVLGHDITATGLFQNKRIEAALKATLPLSDITLFLGKDIRLPDHEVSGTAETLLNIERTFAEGQTTHVSGEAALREVWLGLKKPGITLSAEAGTVDFDIPAQTLQWKFDGLSYDNASYNVSGTLTGFVFPRVVMDIDGPMIGLRVDAVYEDQRIAFNDFSGRWHDSTFRLSGTWANDGAAVDIGGEAVVELADLAFLPEAARALAIKLPGKGSCRVTARLKGPIRTPALWTLQAQVLSDAVRLAGYYIEDIVIDYEQDDGQGVIKNATFRAYDGEGFVKGRLDLTQDAPAYALRGTLERLDLSKLKRDTPLSGRTFFGILSLNTSLQGTLNAPESISGGGHIMIKDGNIWEFNPLRGLGSFLFIPRFSNIVFNDAQGDYFIREGHIETQNTQLMGPELTLLIEGKIGFKGELDFLANTQVPLGPAGRVEEISRAIGTLTKTGNLTAIHVTGTVKDPKYKLQNVGANIVKKFTDLFSNILP